MRKILFTLQLCSVISFVTGCGSSNLAPPGGKDPNHPADHVYHGNCDTLGDPFGGGDGSVASPYLICSAAQVNNVSITAYEAKHFLLYENVDLNSSALLQVALSMETARRFKTGAVMAPFS